MTRTLRVNAIAVAVVSLASLVLANTTGSTTFEDAVFSVAWPLPTILVGFLLTLRRPRLVTGWLFAAIGFLAGTGAAAEALATRGLPAAEPAWWAVAGAWYGEWYWLPMIYVTLVFVPLLFPTGAPPSRRWNRVTGLIVATLALAVVIAMLQEQLDTAGGLSVRNPVGIHGLADVEDGVTAIFLVALTLIYLLVAMASLVVRFRQSSGVERQQLKWFTSAAAALIVGFILQGLLDALFQRRLGFLDIILFTLTPVAAGVAILRYRLYAIDRIISRTVTYALVTALLVATYLGAITVISAAMGSLGAQSPLAVATATLAAAALFQPARRAIQNRVDRRFNRARYDAERTLDGFRERVRTDVDLDRLCGDLVVVTQEALQPSVALVWLRVEEVPT